MAAQCLPSRIFQVSWRAKLFIFIFIYFLFFCVGGLNGIAVSASTNETRTRYDIEIDVAQISDKFPQEIRLNVQSSSFI